MIWLKILIMLFMALLLVKTAGDVLGARMKQAQYQQLFGSMGGRTDGNAQQMHRETRELGNRFLGILVFTIIIFVALLFV